MFTRNDVSLYIYIYVVYPDPEFLGDYTDYTCEPMYVKILDLLKGETIHHPQPSHMPHAHIGLPNQSLRTDLRDILGSVAISVLQKGKLAVNLKSGKLVKETVKETTYP